MTTAIDNPGITIAIEKTGSGNSSYGDLVGTQDQTDFSGTSILQPNTNIGDGGTATFTLSIPETFCDQIPDFIIEKIGLQTFGLNVDGAAQASTTNRFFDISIQEKSDGELQNYYTFTNLNINNPNSHQFLETGSNFMNLDQLQTISLSVSKNSTNTQGCFFGLSEIRLYEIDMTGAPVQNGMYLSFCNADNNTGIVYLQSAAAYPEKLCYGPKTTDGNSYLTLKCIEKVGDVYCFTMSVAGKYVHADRTDRGAEAASLKTLEDGATIADAYKWEIKTQGNGYRVSPKGSGVSLNPWSYSSHQNDAYPVGAHENPGYTETWYFSQVYPVELKSLSSTTLEDGKNAVATFSAEVATTLPSGVNAYYTTTSGDGYVSLTALEVEEGTTTLPANEGFFLTGAAGTVYMEATSETAATIEGNLLKPTTGAAIDASVNAYILNGSTTGVPMFYQLSSTDRVVAKNKAYLEMPTTSGSNAVKLAFGGNVTGIESIDNGQLTMDNDAPIYDLSGRKVLAPAKGGIYVKGGKKIIF